MIDFDLGNPYDDYVGTEPGKNLVYVYNSNLNDQHFQGGSGYGAMPPAAGIINLNRTLNSHILLSNATNLNSATAYNHVLSGLLPDGNTLLDGNSLPTTFVYNDISAGSWNELALGNPPGDRRSVIAHDVEVFGPGKVLCYNHAAIFARKYDGTLTGSVDSLFHVAHYIQNFYDAQDFYCETQFLDVQENQELPISLFPNPANDHIQIGGIESGTFRVINTEGKEILNGNLEHPVIQTESLKNGFYILEITSGGKHGRKSFVKA